MLIQLKEEQKICAIGNSSLFLSPTQRENPRFARNGTRKRFFENSMFGRFGSWDTGSGVSATIFGVRKARSQSHRTKNRFYHFGQSR